MSLTSYRAAPPRGRVCVLDGCVRVGRCGCGGGAASHRVSMVRVSMDYVCGGFRGPGGDRLSRTLGCSIIGAGGFHVRVRDGIGCSPAAMATRLSEPPASASMAGPRIGFDGGFPATVASLGPARCALIGASAWGQVLVPAHRLRWRGVRCVLGVWRCAPRCVDDCCAWLRVALARRLRVGLESFGRLGPVS